MARRTPSRINPESSTRLSKIQSTSVQASSNRPARAKAMAAGPLEGTLKNTSPTRHGSTPVDGSMPSASEWSKRRFVPRAPRPTWLARPSANVIHARSS